MKTYKNINQSMGMEPSEPQYDYPVQNPNMSMVEQVQSGEHCLIASAQSKRLLSEERDYRKSDKHSEGVVINGPHRDIKSSNRLPQAFRIFRAKQNVRKIIKNTQTPNNETRSMNNIELFKHE